MLLFGHPIHPMLVVIPLGLFIMSVIADICRPPQPPC
jgi:uncharacterized membrane protein